MSDTTKSHLEQFVVVFIGFLVSDLATSISQVPAGQILSQGLPFSLIVAAVTTALRATYNKVVIGNSMGVR